MIEFAIAAENLRHILNSLSKLSRNNSGNWYNKIKLVCKGGWITAYATDGYSLRSVQVPIQLSASAESPDFAFVMEPFKFPAMGQDTIPCAYDSDANELLLQTETWICKRKTFSSEDFLDIESVLPKSKIVTKIGINPQYLAETIRPLIKKDSVREPIIMEIRGSWEPIVIYRRQSPDEIQLILPVRLGEKENACQK